jgi:hypothetical protein
MIPKRIMSKRGPAAAIISMAQQASPNWYIQSEYLRPQLSSQETGFGIPNRSITPT